MKATLRAKTLNASDVVRLRWAILLLLLLVMAGAIAAWWRLSPGEAQRRPGEGPDSPGVCVIACNIRIDQGKDGVNAWPNRRDLLAQTLLAEKPDILGLQEAPPPQAVELLARMPDFAAYPDGRDERSALAPLLNFNMTAVLYRKARFEVIGGDHGIIRQGASPDPRVTAYFSLAVLRDLEGTLPELVVVSTHFRHDPRLAAQDAETLNNRITAQRRLHPAAEVILIGDINADKNSQVYRALLGDAAALPANTPTTPLHDTYDYTARHGDKWGSWHNFTGKADADWPTDFILVSQGLRRTPARVIREGKPPVWPTDHWPVVVRITR